MIFPIHCRDSCRFFALNLVLTMGALFSGDSFAKGEADPMNPRCVELLNQLVRPSKLPAGQVTKSADAGALIEAVRSNLKQVTGQDTGTDYQLNWRFELDSRSGKVVFGFKSAGKTFGVELPLEADIKNRNTLFINLPRDDAQNLLDLNLLAVVLETLNQKVSSEYKFKIVIDDPQSIELLNDSFNKIYLESGDIATPARRVLEEDANILADLELIDSRRDSVFSGLDRDTGDELRKRINADKDIQSLMMTKMEESEFFRSIRESTDWVGHFEMERSFMPHDYSQTEGKEVIYPFHWVLSLEALF